MSSRRRKGMRAPERHRHEAPMGRLRYLVVTVSTSRYDRQRNEGGKVSDESGDVAQQIIERANGDVSERKLIPDDASVLKSTLSQALGKTDLDVIVLTGGT